jgi:drug/metabolite transporter (DMT)-like permease
MKLKEWSAFWLLGLVWGSSFLWIKIAVGYMGPLTVAALRQLIGLLGLLLVMAIQRQSFPRGRQTLLAYLVLGILQSAVPFALIAWGETRIDSGLAAILNGTMPLFTILIAHVWLRDDRITPARLAGLVIGFGGVVVLASRSLGPSELQGTVWGQLAVLAATLSYAVASTFSRRHLREQPPLLQATMVVLIGDALLWPAVAIAERPLHLPAGAWPWLALVWLGLLGSCLAYLLYFYLIRAWGPTRASLVTYVFPVIGLVLGIAFLGERADWHLVLGSLLVVSSIVVVNLRPRGGRLPSCPPSIDARLTARASVQGAASGSAATSRKSHRSCPSPAQSPPRRRAPRSADQDNRG